MQKIMFSAVLVSLALSVSASAHDLCDASKNVQKISASAEGPYNRVYQLNDKARAELAQKMAKAQAQCPAGEKLVECGNFRSEDHLGGRPLWLTQVNYVVKAKCE
jgi:hypothetical protein